MKVEDFEQLEDFEDNSQSPNYQQKKPPLTEVHREKPLRIHAESTGQLIEFSGGKGKAQHQKLKDFARTF